MSLQQGTMPPSERHDVISALRALLRHGDAPGEFPAASWARYQAWLNSASADEFGEFLSNFEWALGMPDAPSMANEVRRLVQELALADSAETAGRVYERLFASVFSMLARPGTKRLTRADLQAALATVGDGTTQLIMERLQLVHLQFAGRVESLEEQVIALNASMTTTMTGTDTIPGSAFGGSRQLDRRRYKTDREMPVTLEFINITSH